MADLDIFRQETRDWLEDKCPQKMRNLSFHWEDAHGYYQSDAAKQWLKAMSGRGWTAPMWPKQYAGGGLSLAKAKILQEELDRIKALPATAGMGLSMIGPTLLEFGTEAQKQRHIPRIVSGEVSWCQGYSEPGAGSDLAALQTKAVVDGDMFVLNGQKVWTSGAQYADWMFALVRTDPEAPKHEGISFILLDMHQPGVIIKPISLISGSSPFCETFFDNALAKRDDLIGELNRGWSIGKRLLQFERSGIGGLSGAGGEKKQAKQNDMACIAKQYVGEIDGKIANQDAREQVLTHSMHDRAFQLTAQRVREESLSGKTPGATTSIFKLVGAGLARDSSALKSVLMGSQGIGWEGAGFNTKELEATKNWLSNRAVTIYGGTNEVQMNIIAKRVLGLPE